LSPRIPSTSLPLVVVWSISHIFYTRSATTWHHTCLAPSRFYREICPSNAPCGHSKLARLPPAEPSQGAQESSNQCPSQCSRSALNKQQSSAAPRLFDAVHSAHLRFRWSGCRSCSHILRLSTASSSHVRAIPTSRSSAEPHKQPEIAILYYYATARRQVIRASIFYTSRLSADHNRAWCGPGSSPESFGGGTRTNIRDRDPS